ncbi:MAG: hypothetical protein HY897_12685 [Deltaproteobacteria bacterium]|nr:hypothetical protein [Deltaproteobacteria bacterium]
MDRMLIRRLIPVVLAIMPVWACDRGGGEADGAVQDAGDADAGAGGGGGDSEGEQDADGGDEDGGVYNPVIRPEDFVAGVTNQYFPLKPGTLFTYKSEDEDNTVEVLSETKVVLGVTCTVVLDRVLENGDLKEETYDWYAQDKAGNVWYMGEDSKTYSGGVLTGTEGSWEAGVDGAKPGIILEADPQPGDSYRQEYYESEAEDMGDVVSLGESVTVPAGTYADCLKTRDWTPLEPGVSEFKYYARGVGFVLETAPDGSGRLELISVAEKQ